MARHVLTREQIARYADLSHDHNPLHVDEAVAAASPFKGIVAHGFLLLGGAFAAMGEATGYPKRLECRFQAPGRPGEVLETTVSPAGEFRVDAAGQILVTGRVST